MQCHLGDLTLASLIVLEREAPAHLDEMRRYLGARVLRVQVATESSFWLRARWGSAWVTDVPCPHDVELGSTSAGLGELLRGRESLATGVLRGHLQLQGRLPDLVAVLDTFAVWTHGVLRAPGARSLMQMALSRYWVAATERSHMWS